MRYCGACPTYINGGCSGCEDEHTTGDCFTRGCVKKEIDFCKERKSFPCNTIITSHTPPCLIRIGLRGRRKTGGVDESGNQREYKTYNEWKFLVYTQVQAGLPTRITQRCCATGLNNSILTFAAYEGDRFLGIIRTVGDGYTIDFVQDILVFPEHQRKGIGSVLLQAVLDRYSHVRQIELETDNTPKTIAFYESMGFREMSEIGCCGFMNA